MSGSENDGPVSLRERLYPTEVSYKDFRAAALCGGVFSIGCMEVWDYGSGAALGLIFVPPVAFFFVLPSMRFLHSIGQLRLWWVLPLGGLAAASPDLLISALGGCSSGGLQIGPHVMQDHEGYTEAGLRYFFFERPMMFLPFGMIGAVFGWLMTFGLWLWPERNCEISLER